MHLARGGSEDRSDRHALSNGERQAAVRLTKDSRLTLDSAHLPSAPAGAHGFCLSSRSRRGLAGAGGGAAALRAPLGAGTEIITADDAASARQAPRAAALPVSA